MTLAQQILSAHEQHPEWGAAHIARELNCQGSYVRIVGMRRGIRLPRSIRKRPTRKTPEERFWAKVEKKESGCWEWTAGTQGSGYAAFRIKNKKVNAHRWLYMHLHGWQPSDVEICHRCDNRICVNPDHLFPGSKSDNMQDCAAKGRNGSQRRRAERIAALQAEGQNP